MLFSKTFESPNSLVIVYANSYTLFLLMKSVSQILVLYELGHIFICVLQIVAVLLNVPFDFRRKK